MAEAPLTARVVEVLADLGEGHEPRYRVGSGCIVAGRTVLTAAHVVTGAVGVQVRDPGKVLHPAVLDPGFVGDADGTPARWSLFLAWLEGLMRAGSASVEIVASARATFLAFARWVER